MGAVVAEDGVRGLGEVSPEGDLVAHCAAENEKGGGVGGEGCNVGLKIVGSGVFGEDVVEESGVLSGGEH